MRRYDPAGVEMPPTAYVFGNELGQRVTTIKTAWKLACKRAGIGDLHFHDLRREAGSRWLEGGVPFHTVKAWLGHANISQTSTYLANTVQTQHDAMAGGCRFCNGWQRKAKRGAITRHHGRNGRT